MDSYEKVFQNSVVSNFEFLKRADNVQQAYLRAMKIKDIGFLVPICHQHLEDKQIIENLTKWRNEFVDVFPTQFKAEFDGTKRWLKEQVLDNHARILFLVVNKSGKALGHLGFNNCLNNECSFEIDNVVRGEMCEERNTFGLALEQAMKWARETINVNKFWLRVFSENQHAINFYLRNNFVEEKRIGLKKEVENNLIKYLPSKVNTLNRSKSYSNCICHCLRLIANTSSSSMKIAMDIHKATLSSKSNVSFKSLKNTKLSSNN